MPLNLDYFNKIVEVTSPTIVVTAQELHDFIEDEGSSVIGMLQPEDTLSVIQSSMFSGGIIQPEGKIDIDPNNPGTKFSQIIIILHPDWQIRFWQGSGYTEINGGTIVGGVSNFPVAPSGAAGDITYFRSPLDGTALSGGGSTPTAVATAVWSFQTDQITVTGSIGVFVLKKLLDFLRWFGLK